VTETAPARPAPVHRGTGLPPRVLHAIVAGCALVVLDIAWWLEPAAAGHSTHTQLGLPGCTFMDVTGVPCPMCGATTTFSLLAEGQVVRGVVNQPFASLLFFATVAVVGISGAEVIQPRQRWRRIEDVVRPVEPWVAIAILAAMLAGWIWKIAMLAQAA